VTLENLTFDDDCDEDLSVFSGSDLLMSHYDIADLDWAEVADRTLIDERRGLVITQAVVIEDVIDEFILYLDDPPDPARYRTETMGGWTAGRRRQEFEKLLRRARLLESNAVRLLDECRAVAERRNTLAHGSIQPRLINVANPAQVVIPVSDLQRASLAIEWTLTDRRTSASERISMARLRRDLEDAQSLVATMLDYAEEFVERAGVDRPWAGLPPEALDPLDEALGSIGATPRWLAPVGERLEEPLSEFVEGMRDGLYSWTWGVEEGERRRIAEGVGRWAEERFGDLAAPTVREYRIRFRAYDLP
jgi:hypothetical protein